MREAAPSGRVVRFGVFEADLESGELRKQGRRLGLQEQPFRILMLLLDRPGQVITRDEIRGGLWEADTFVDFNHGLNKAMNRLRDALGDSADSPRFIETIPKRGYRFIAPVERIQTTDAGPVVSAESVKPLPPPIVRATSRSKTWFVLAAGLLVAGGVATTLYVWRAPGLTGRAMMVLADFENRTGDPAFDDVMRQALSIALQDSLQIVTMPDQRVADTLRLMHRDPNQRLTPELAREVCQRTGSKAVLGGYITSLGSEYVIGITATNCSNGATLSEEQVRAGRKEEVLGRFEPAVARLRQALGPAAFEGRARPRARPPRPPAARAFSPCGVRPTRPAPTTDPHARMPARVRGRRRPERKGRAPRRTAGLRDRPAGWQTAARQACRRARS